MKSMVGGDLFIKLGFARWINVFFSGQSIGRFAMPVTLRGTTTSLKSFARVNKDTQESTKTSLAEPKRSENKEGDFWVNAFRFPVRMFTAF